MAFAAQENGLKRAVPTGNQIRQKSYNLNMRKTARAYQQIPTRERTRAGKQHVFPGAERISDAELVKRWAAKPITPKTEPNPAHEGLFSDESKHTDLFEITDENGVALARSG